MYKNYANESKQYFGCAKLKLETRRFSFDVNGCDGETSTGIRLLSSFRRKYETLMDGGPVGRNYTFGRRTIAGEE